MQKKIKAAEQVLTEESDSKYKSDQKTQIELMKVSIGSLSDGTDKEDWLDKNLSHIHEFESAENSFKTLLIHNALQNYRTFLREEKGGSKRRKSRRVRSKRRKTNRRL
jgi:hypothetical protein